MHVFRVWLRPEASSIILVEFLVLCPVLNLVLRLRTVSNASAQSVIRCRNNAILFTS